MKLKQIKVNIHSYIYFTLDVDGKVVLQLIDLIETFEKNNIN